MEINAEMNKVFGQEMAKLFAATIDEKELKEKTQEVWREMNYQERSYYNSRTNSKIERYIEDQILNRLYEKIENILKEPINEELLEKKAREMVGIAKRAGEEAIIRDMAKHMADNVLSVYSRDESIIQEILSQMNLQKENNRLY